MERVSLPFVAYLEPSEGVLPESAEDGAALVSVFELSDTGLVTDVDDGPTLVSRFVDCSGAGTPELVAPVGALGVNAELVVSVEVEVAGTGVSTVFVRVVLTSLAAGSLRPHPARTKGITTSEPNNMREEFFIEFVPLRS